MATGFPFSPRRLIVAIAVTNVDPDQDHEMAFSIVAADDDKPLFRHAENFQVEHQHRLSVANFEVELRGVTFPSPGHYIVRFAMDGRIIGVRPFRVDYPDNMIQG
jgi:hypothetical protein